jgi:hypothetical protein
LGFPWDSIGKLNEFLEEDRIIQNVENKTDS